MNDELRVFGIRGVDLGLEIWAGIWLTITIFNRSGL